MNIMKDTITEFFFFSEEDLWDFHYDTHKFGGLRFFLVFGVFFLAVKLGIDNPKSSINFFRMCRKFLEGIEGLSAYDGYKYSASGMINFFAICAFMSLRNARRRFRIP
jgi:hypothetical protein